MSKEKIQKDMWLDVKEALKSEKPEDLIYASNHLLIQSRYPELRDVVMPYQPKILDIVLNSKVDLRTRIEAIGVLSKLGITKIRKNLEKIFEQKNPQLINVTAEAIRKEDPALIVAHDTVTTLIKTFEEEDDWSLQYDAILALQHFKDNRIIPTFLKALDHKEQAIRREAIYGLGEQQAKEAIPRIIEKLKTHDQEMTAASLVLERLGTPESLIALSDEKNYEKVLKGAEDFVSGRFTVGALAQFRLPRVDDDLIKLAKSEDIEVSEGAMKGLVKRHCERALIELAPHFLRDKWTVGKFLQFVADVVGQSDKFDPNTAQKLASDFEKVSPDVLAISLEQTEQTRYDYERFNKVKRERFIKFAQAIEQMIKDTKIRDLVHDLFSDPSETHEKTKAITEKKVQAMIHAHHDFLEGKDEQRAPLFSHITDPELKKVYAKLSHEDYLAYLNGKKLAIVATDKLAVWEAVNQALENIISDLDEHGEINKNLYGDHSKIFFQQEKKKIEERIEKLKADGKASTVFAEYKKKYDADIQRAVDETIGEVMPDLVEQEISHKLIHEYKANNEAAPEAADVIAKIKNIKAPSNKFVDFINGIVSNQLIYFLTYDQRIDDAVKISQTYIDSVKDNVEKWNKGVNLNELAGNLLGAGGFCKRPEFINWTLEHMIKPTDINPRLSYNLACSFAILKDKEKMLEWVKKARAMGKPTEQFEDDSDFSVYKNDQDFLNAIK